MKEKFYLKDHLFNKDSVSYLADLFVVTDANFNRKKFVAEVVGRFPELELKERIGWMSEVLTKHLPTNISAALKMIVAALPPRLNPNNTDDDFGSFILAPLGEYVVRVGCNKKYLKLSLRVLRELTMRFSMEFYIRPFIHNFPTETLAVLDTWVTDRNYHVRRLVSEGMRPSLPWAQKINLDYKVSIKYLDILHADKTRYVTRSVANHLNDISKKDPVLVVATLKRWQKDRVQEPSELGWMTRHALRTLVKRGDVAALQLLGFSTESVAAVSKLTVPKKIKRGDRMIFSFDIVSDAAQNLLVDYIIDFVKLNGTTKPKVFKIKKLTVAAGAKNTIEKNHYLKADATTFKLNPGTHTLTIQINGQKLATKKFEVY